jgi:hypothetical protein
VEEIPAEGGKIPDVNKLKFVERPHTETETETVRKKLGLFR